MITDGDILSSILAVHHYNHTCVKKKKKCKKKAHNCCIPVHGAVSQEPCFVSVREKLSPISQTLFPKKRNASHFISDSQE